MPGKLLIVSLEKMDMEMFVFKLVIICLHVPLEGIKVEVLLSDDLCVKDLLIADKISWTSASIWISPFAIDVLRSH